MVKSLFSKQEPADPVPHYEPGPFLSSVEGTVYQALSEMFDVNIKVFAKVCLAGLVAPLKPNRQYLAHWRRVQRRTIDFLIYSTSAHKPILAIKLETEMAGRKRRINGPDILEGVLEDIELPLLRLRAQDEYDIEDLTRKINLTLNEGRQRGQAISHDPHETEETTTTLNRKLTAATQSVAGLWTSAKEKYRTRVPT